MHKLIKALRIVHLPGGLDALLRYHVAASTEHLHALRDLRCRTVVDIGANRGQFSLLAHALFPEAQIFAFEPLEKPASTYRRVFAHISGVRLSMVAIGSQASEALLHVAARDDSSSLLPIGTAQLHLFPGTYEVATAHVAVRR